MSPWMTSLPFLRPQLLHRFPSYFSLQDRKSVAPAWTASLTVGLLDALLLNPSPSLLSLTLAGLGTQNHRP